MLVTMHSHQCFIWAKLSTDLRLTANDDSDSNGTTKDEIQTTMKVSMTKVPKAGR